MRKLALLLALIFFASFALAQGDQQAKPDPSAAFSDRAMNAVLLNWKKAMEDHVEGRLLAEFDAKRMDGYLELESQIDQFFRKYDGFQFHYRILQTSGDEVKGVALVEVQVEASPRQDGGTALRRDQQIWFELEPGKKGWKIVNFEPRDFFAT